MLAWLGGSCFLHKLGWLNKIERLPGLETVIGENKWLYKLKERRYLMDRMCGSNAYLCLTSASSLGVRTKHSWADMCKDCDVVKSMKDREECNYSIASSMCGVTNTIIHLQ